MTITVSNVPNKIKQSQNRRKRPHPKFVSAAQLEARLRKSVIDSFDSIGFKLLNGGGRYDSSVTFAGGRGIKDLVFENGTLSKWQAAKVWLENAGFYKEAR